MELITGFCCKTIIKAEILRTGFPLSYFINGSGRVSSLLKDKADPEEFTC